MYGTQGVEGGFELHRDDVGECRFADTGRTPQYEGGDFSAVDHAAQHRPFAHEMFLPDVFIERFGSQSFG